MSVGFLYPTFLFFITVPPRYINYQINIVTMIEKLVDNFEDFINEKHIVFKRKYTDNHPEKKVGAVAPIREKVLSYLSENGTVSKTVMMEFIAGLNEETGGKTSRKWLNKNTHLVSVTEKNGEKYYSLTATGKRVHDKIVKSANA